MLTWLIELIVIGAVSGLVLAILIRTGKLAFRAVGRFFDWLEDKLAGR